MRLAISLLSLLCAAAPLRGQHVAPPQSQDEQAVEELLDKIREQQPPDWSFADLAARADLIAIAKVQSKVEVEWNDVTGEDLGKGSTRLMSNRLSVLSTLKGIAGREIEVLTLEWKPDVMVLTNHHFAQLHPKRLLPNDVPVVIDGEIVDYAERLPIQSRTIEPEYLLYLRRIDGNKYVSVTGQRYSGMGIREIK